MHREKLFNNYHLYYKGGNIGNVEDRFIYYDDDYAGHLPENKNANILDVGCGMGHFLSYLKNKGYVNLQGVDICNEQVEWCKENVLTEVMKVESLESFFSSTKEVFDMITMNDLVEHLPKESIVDVLVEARKCLKSDGKLLVRLPNMSNIFGIYLFYNDFTHETGFTEYSLRQLLNLSGFNDIEIFGNKVRVNSLWKRFFRYLIATVFNTWITVALKYVYMPGSKQPTIMSTFLIALAKE